MLMQNCTDQKHDYTHTATCQETSKLNVNDILHNLVFSTRNK